LRSLQFIPELQPENGQPYPVRIKGVKSEVQLFAKNPMDEIHVYPRAGGGGGKQGLMEVLLGVTLIGLAAFAPGVIAPLAEIGISRGMVGLFGLSLASGGLIQMLMPTPEGDQAQGSKYLGSGGNTVMIGTRIPILYGTRKVGGHYLSYDIDAKDVAIEASGTETFTGGYVEHDATPVQKAVILPIYPSATPASTNIPTSGWSGA